MLIRRLGVIAMCQDQLLIRYNVRESGLEWRDLTGGGQLTDAGYFLNFATSENRRMYLTTLNRLDKSACGVWYCPDFTVSNPVWTLVKDNTTADVEAGYVGTFGAIDTRPSGDYCAAFHADSGVTPAVQSKVLVGRAATSAWWTIPQVNGQNVFPQSVDSEVLHAIFADEENGTFYICVGWQNPRSPSVVWSNDGITWGSEEFQGNTGLTAQFMRCVHRGYCVAESKETFQSYDSTQKIAGLFVDTLAGITADYSRTTILYDLSVNYQYLYKSGVQIMDAWITMGLGRDVGHATFLSETKTDIATACLDIATQGAGDRVVLFSPNGGLTWQNRTDNLYVITGGQWNGASLGGINPRGNSFVKPFEYLAFSGDGGENMIGIGAGAGRTYTNQDGTVYLKKDSTFDHFEWLGRCGRIDGDSSENLGGFTVTNRLNPLGGIERDGVLLDPPQETTFTLMMKRKQAETAKSELRKCFWIIDQRMFCKDPQAWNSWEEITRFCTCKANTRTITGTMFDGSQAEAMIGLPETCLSTTDIYRVSGEELVFTAP